MLVNCLRQNRQIGQRSPGLGLDLGQAHDYTALAVLERVDAEQSTYHVVHLERFPIGTPYPAIVEKVGTLLITPPLRPYVPLITDATGVGTPVVELLMRAGLRPVPVKIHGGQSVTRDDEGAYHVPKRDLASVVAVLLQDRRLRVAQALAEASTLVNELLTFRVKITTNGQDTYEAWRERDHDDLVLAVALACWYGEHCAGVPVFGEFRPDVHVAKEAVTPQPGCQIVRGWRIGPPAAVVWFQIDRHGRCRIVYEHPPREGEGLEVVRSDVLTASSVLFPGFAFEDYAEPEAFQRPPGGTSCAIGALRPYIAMQRGEAASIRRLETGRQWLTKAVRGEPAVMIDPRCDALIRALSGGYMYRRLQGQNLGVPQENDTSQIVDAWLGALACPAATLTPLERQQMRGPRVLRPT